MNHSILVLAAALTFSVAPSANAAIDLVQVPAACGTLKDVYDLLNVNMPVRVTIGKGGDSRGDDLVVLFNGAGGHWALVAALSPNSYCVVASGRNWRTVTPQTVGDQ